MLKKLVCMVFLCGCFLGQGVFAGRPEDMTGIYACLKSHSVNFDEAYSCMTEKGISVSDVRLAAIAYFLMTPSYDKDNVELYTKDQLAVLKQLITKANSEIKDRQVLSSKITTGLSQGGSLSDQKANIELKALRPNLLKLCENKTSFRSLLQTAFKASFEDKDGDYSTFKECISSHRDTCGELNSVSDDVVSAPDCNTLIDALVSFSQTAEKAKKCPCQF